MSKAEFTDFVGAEAFYAKGRGGERPLKDGWNTKLVKITPDEFDIQLHGRTLIRYLRTGNIGIMVSPKISFVEANRIQRYALGDRFFLERQTLYKPGEILPYSIANEVRMKTPVATLSAGELWIDAAGTITGSAYASPPAFDYRKFWKSRITQFVRTTMKALDKHEIGMSDGLACKMCQWIESVGTVGDYMADPEHLYTHVLENKPLATVLAACNRQPTYGQSIEAFGLDAASGTLGHNLKEYQRNQMKSQLSRYLKITMRAW